jgi:3-oxoadipate enol-lactonase
MPVARAGRCPLHYEDRGDPRAPALLLVRGLGRSGRYWGRFADLLEPGFRLLIPDNRGVGHSGAGRPPYTTAQMARDLEAVLDHAGAERAHVFGMSLGGMVAQELALGHGPRVGRLVLGCTTPGGRRARKNPWRAVVALLRAGVTPPARSIQVIGPYILADSTRRDRPEILEWWLELARTEPPSRAGLIGQLVAAARHDAWDRLPDIAAPTLVLTGADDRLTPPDNSRMLAERIPGARLELLPGAGHDFTTDQPERTAALVRAFLDG